MSVEKELDEEISSVDESVIVDGVDESQKTECDRDDCFKETLTDATVDVVVGHEIGQWDESVTLIGAAAPPHVGVTGAQSRQPVVEQWCPHCASKEFDVTAVDEVPFYKNTPWITTRTIISFLLGAMFVAIILL